MATLEQEPGAETPPRRRAGRRDAARSRAAILAAARAEFARHGFGGARVDAIAARARINKRMLYHYFGNKQALYLAVLEDVYMDIRARERALQLDDLSPEDGMRRLIGFTWDYFNANPEFLALLNGENIMRAQHLQRSRRIRELHSPLVEMIAGLLRRGAQAGVFRRDVDPVQLYISIAALGFFYLSNRWTLSTIFGRDLAEPEALAARGRHIIEMVMGYLRPAAGKSPPPLPDGRRES